MKPSRRSFIGGLAAFAAAIAIPFKATARATKSVAQHVPVLRTFGMFRMKAADGIFIGQFVSYDDAGNLVPAGATNNPVIGMCTGVSQNTGVATIAMGSTLDSKTRQI